MLCFCFFFFQAEDGIRDLVRSRGLGDVYKRQDKHRPYGLRVVGVGVDHVVEIGHLLFGVANHREVDLMAGHILDVAFPAMVGFDPVHTQANHLAVAFLELALERGRGAKFSGAHGREAVSYTHLTLPTSDLV